MSWVVVPHSLNYDSIVNKAVLVLVMPQQFIFYYQPRPCWRVSKFEDSSPNKSGLIMSPPLTLFQPSGSYNSGKSPSNASTHPHRVMQCQWKVLWRIRLATHFSSPLIYSPVSHSDWEQINNPGQSRKVPCMKYQTTYWSITRTRETKTSQSVSRQEMSAERSAQCKAHSPIDVVVLLCGLLISASRRPTMLPSHLHRHSFIIVRRWFVASSLSQERIFLHPPVIV